MAMTLLEAFKVSNIDPLKYLLIEEFILGDLIATIPWQDVPGSGVHYNREDTLPGIGFRGYNEAHEESIGILNPESEALKLFGGDLDVDKAIVDMQGPQARVTHTLLKAKAARMALERTIIKGDSTSNPKEFDGWQRRVTGSQLISNAAAGAALSLNKLDEAIDAVDAPGGNKYLVMSRNTRRRLTQAGRNTSVGGYITTEQDRFGRKLSFYQEIPILTVFKDNLANDIMPFTETSPDGSSSTACTSIYCVAFGDMQVTGIQGAVGGTYGISARDLGELNTKPVFRTRMDWYVAQAIYNGRAISRLAGITDAPVTV
jgi:hypothetical protein